MKKIGHFLFSSLLIGSVLFLTLGDLRAQIQVGADIDGEAVFDQSGWSVSLSADGSMLAIGAPGNDGNGSNSGHVRVYRNDNGIWTQVGADIDGEAGDGGSGRSVSLSADGSMVAIGAPGNAGNGSRSGHVRVYRNANGAWTQVGADIDGEAASDQSGWSVSLSADGSVLAIGASQNDGNGLSSGHVRVYRNDNGVWTQIGADIDGEAAGDFSGISVSLSTDGSVVAIGAHGNDGNGFYSGHVRVYRNVNGAWTQIGADIDGEAIFDGSGIRVSLSADGSVVAIGASGNNGNGFISGHVRVYRNVNGAWTQIGADIDGEAAGDGSGNSVSLSADGSVVAIGAPENAGNGSGSGHVRVYRNDNGVWTQVGVDMDGEATGDNSGRSVSLSVDGSVLAIGAPGNAGNDEGENDLDSGYVRVYNLNNLPCLADAGDLITTQPTTSLEICQGSDLLDDQATPQSVVFEPSYQETDETNPGAGYDYAILLADADSMVVAVDTVAPFDIDFSILPVGTYTLYGLSYQEGNTPDTITTYLNSILSNGTTNDILEIIQDDDDTSSGGDGMGMFCLDLDNRDTSGEVVEITIKTLLTANAGTDQTVCNASYTLQGNAITEGTGQWAFVDNPENLGQLANPTSPNAILSTTYEEIDLFEVTPVELQRTFKLKWTVTNAPCAEASDEVIITLQPPVSAGNNQLAVCGTSFQLGANPVADGTGQWQLISNPSNSGSLDDTADPRATLMGEIGTTYELTWQVTGGECDGSMDNVTIRFQPDSDNDTVQDCADLCEGGDDNINTDNTGMPDACDCNPNSAEGEFVTYHLVDFTPIVDNRLTADFQINAQVVLSNTDFPQGLTFKAGNNVLLESGFHAQAGMNFSAIIAPCQEATNVQNFLSATARNSQSLSSIEKVLPLDLRIAPNVAHNSTTLYQSLSEAQPITLQLFNQNGQLVQTLLNQVPQAAGTHEAILEVGQLPAGLYFVRMQGTTSVITKRLVVIK